MIVRDFRKTFRQGSHWYAFRFARGPDFPEALSAFKQLVPLDERFYDAEGGHLWGVRVEFAERPEIANQLAEIFANWAGCVDMISRQLAMW